jgi:hypothetical protein
VIDTAFAHPHDLQAGVPHRLPGAVVRVLSEIDTRRALAARWRQASRARRGRTR